MWRGQLTNVDACPLAELPSELGRLSALKDLSLVGCARLKEVPAWVLRLPGLQVPFQEWRVRVSDGTVVDEEYEENSGERVKIKDTEVLVRVRPDRVDLSAHELVELPVALRRCAGRVHELKVASSALVILPTWLGELVNLELLVLGLRIGVSSWKGCPLTVLPAELGSLKALRMLDLSGCKEPTVLPAELRLLTTLKTLNLSGCQGLTALTARQVLVMGVCTRPRALLVGLTALQTLNLSGCSGLKMLPAELGALTALKVLDLSECSGLATLPAELGELTALKELYLVDCQSLTTLPGEIGELKALERLNLSS